MSRCGWCRCPRCWWCWWPDGPELTVKLSPSTTAHLYRLPTAHAWPRHRGPARNCVDFLEHGLKRGLGQEQRRLWVRMFWARFWARHTSRLGPAVTLSRGHGDAGSHEGYLPCGGIPEPRMIPQQRPGRHTADTLPANFHQLSHFSFSPAARVSPPRAPRTTAGWLSCSPAVKYPAQSKLQHSRRPGCSYHRMRHICYFRILQSPPSYFFTPDQRNISTCAIYPFIDVSFNKKSYRIVINV